MKEALFFILPYLITSLVFYNIDARYSSNRMFESYWPHLLSIYKKIWKQVFFNLFILHPTLLYLVLKKWPQNAKKIQIQYLILFILGFELFFTTIHKCLHFKPLYKMIHFKHHEIRHSVAFAGIFCHPIEFAIGNFLPTVLPIILTGPHHPNLINLFSLLASVSVCLSHSGYGGFNHLRHHMFKNKHFGFLGIF